MHEVFLPIPFDRGAFLQFAKAVLQELRVDHDPGDFRHTSLVDDVNDLGGASEIHRKEQWVSGDATITSELNAYEVADGPGSSRSENYALTVAGGGGFTIENDDGDHASVCTFNREDDEERWIDAIDVVMTAWLRERTQYIDSAAVPGAWRGEARRLTIYGCPRTCLPGENKDRLFMASDDGEECFGLVRSFAPSTFTDFEGVHVNLQVLPLGPLSRGDDVRSDRVEGPMSAVPTIEQFAARALAGIVLQQETHDERAISYPHSWPENSTAIFFRGYGNVDREVVDVWAGEGWYVRRALYTGDSFDDQVWMEEWAIQNEDGDPWSYFLTLVCDRVAGRYAANVLFKCHPEEVEAIDALTVTLGAPVSA